MDNKNLFKELALVAGAAVGCLAISLAIMAWSEPGSTPPGGNVAAPLNTSADAQTKSGPLGFNSGRTYWIDKVGESLALKTGGDIASAATKFIIGSDGHVGIGTEAPATTLDLGGTGRIARIQDPIDGQDVATKAWAERLLRSQCPGSVLDIKFTEQIYTGNLGGKDGAQAKCDAAYPAKGYHFCSVGELIAFGSGCMTDPGQYLGQFTAWVDDVANNCLDWTSEAGLPATPSQQGANLSNYNSIPGYESPGSVTCSTDILSGTVTCSYSGDVSTPGSSMPAWKLGTGLCALGLPLACCK